MDQDGAQQNPGFGQHAGCGLALAGMDDNPWAETELEDIVFDHSRAPNVDEKQEYLRFLAEGMTHYYAAKLVGKTASAFKTARRRDRSFGARAAALEKQSVDEDALGDAIRGSLLSIAIGHLVKDGLQEHPKSFEALKMLAEAKLPEWEYKRTKSVRHGQDAPFEIVLGQKVPEEDLARLTAQEREVLRQAVKMIEDTRAHGELRAIEGGKE